jgi:hypothetical protein
MPGLSSFARSRSKKKRAGQTKMLFHLTSRKEFSLLFSLQDDTFFKNL